jgi:hypothetical protein
VRVGRVRGPVGFAQLLVYDFMRGLCNYYTELKRSGFGV